MPPRKATSTAKSAASEDVFDLEAAVAEIDLDINDEPFVFKYAGKEWKMRAASDSDARILANIELNETQQVMAYMRDLLGDQWDVFPRISFQAALVLIEKYSEHTQNLSLGESEASTDS